MRMKECERGGSPGWRGAKPEKETRSSSGEGPPCATRGGRGELQRYRPRTTQGPSELVQPEAIAGAWALTALATGPARTPPAKQPATTPASASRLSRNIRRGDCDFAARGVSYRMKSLLSRLQPGNR